MTLFSSLIIHLPLLLLRNAADAQTFSDLPLSPSWPGISDTCTQALNTTVSCPGFLGVVSIDNERLNSQNLSSLCVESCRSSLESVRQTIQDGCAEDVDIITYGTETYPATFVIDRFLYTYDLSCRRDPDTNEFCDSLLVDWLNQNSLTAAQNCSDCILGSMQTQLNSPFGYDDEFAEDFASLTASCSASGYSFTSPAPYALNSTVTVTSEASAPTASSCYSTYTVVANDTCNGIALANNVSTYGIIGPNGLLPDCESLAEGAVLCLPGPCRLYEVQPEDTCEGIIEASRTGISDTQFLAWNPNINALCGNLYDLKGTYICLSPPGGSVGNVQATTTLAVSTPSSAVPKPTNAFNESNSNCGRWYTIQEGDYCDKVSIMFGISLKDFYFLNPEVNSDCTNLLLGIAYCVQAVGSIATYSGYSTSQYFTLTSATYTTTALSMESAWPTFTYTTPSQLPTASGTVPNCATYRNYIEVPPVVDQSQPDGTTANFLTDFVNTCTYITGSYGVSLDDLLSWNPSLSSDNCTFAPGYSYCVEQNAVNTTYTDLGGCLDVNATIIPDGTIATCSCFTFFNGYDAGSYLCVNIADDFGISVSDLHAWNSWIGSDCDASLYADLAELDERAICVGDNSTTSTTTTTTPSSATTAAASSIGPTQTGTVAGCTEFYTVQSGDSCAAIEAAYSITFAQFYAWNPSIGSDCENLWLGYAYCVAAPSTVTTTVSTPTQTHGPIRSGTPDDCTEYYTVQSGDSCAAIAEAYGISFETLYKWNTDIGDDCQYLWTGYAVCVAGGT